MTDDRMALLDLIEKRADADLVREMLGFVAERLMTGRGRHAQHLARGGRAAWGHATGFGRRNAAGRTFPSLKPALGPGLRPGSLDAQRVEASIAVRALDRMAALGMPRVERVA